MVVRYFQYDKKNLILLKESLPVSDWQNQPTWIHIKTNDRKAVFDFFKEKNIYSDAESHILNPENGLKAQKLKKGAVDSLVISDKENIYQPDYITFIVHKELIITIISDHATDIDLDEINVSRIKLLNNLPATILYLISAKILTLNTQNALLARKRIHVLEDLLVSNPEDLESTELIACTRDINRLADIIEDQYIGFGVIASLSKFDAISNLEYNEYLKGFESLTKAMDRLEEKAETLRFQFVLYQQEKSSRKINVLTIIQAIFVPLTFLAGIYGMNFTNIPELNHPNGYFILWGVFIVIASALIFYFYKNGWFE